MRDTVLEQYLAKMGFLRDDYVDQEMHKSYRVMIESAMCAAENFAQVKNRTNLFLLESRDYARIINFYRKYFKETYSEIFIGTVKQIVNK